MRVWWGGRCCGHTGRLGCTSAGRALCVAAHPQCANGALSVSVNGQLDAPAVPEGVNFTYFDERSVISSCSRAWGRCSEALL